MHHQTKKFKNKVKLNYVELSLTTLTILRKNIKQSKHSIVPFCISTQVFQVSSSLNLSVFGYNIPYYCAFPPSLCLSIVLQFIALPICASIASVSVREGGVRWGPVGDLAALLASFTYSANTHWSCTRIQLILERRKEKEKRKKKNRKKS